MGVDAVYLLDEKKRIRRAFIFSVYELIHDEGAYTLTAEIDSAIDATPGEFIAFTGIDGKLLFFEIDEAEKDEARGVTSITATDAAVAELTKKIAAEIRLENATAQEAAQAAIDGSGFVLGRCEGGDKRRPVSAYRDTRWKVLRGIATDFTLRVTPRYETENGEIVRKVVNVTARENVFRGRLFEGGGQAKIYVSKSGAPIARMYGVGRATGTEDPPSCVTIAQAAWSRANGDPADKPIGQPYIEDPETAELYGNGREAVFTDKNVEDPQELLRLTWEDLQKRKRPKVSGTATASDMEHIPGHEHKAVRLYDLVWVRTKHGEDVSAAVIGIKRNYLREDLTKITIGEEADDSGLIRKIARLSSASASLGRSNQSSRNRYIEAKQLIQLNADTIQMNARYIEANAEQIRLTASNLAKYEEGTDERLTLAELTLYGDGTSANAGLRAQVDNHEASISLHADELGALARIKADRIELQGYVTATQLAAEIATIKNEFTYQQAVQHLYAAASLTFQGFPIERRTKKVVTSIGVTKEYVTIPGANGLDYVTIGGLTINPKEEELWYLAWA